MFFDMPLEELEVYKPPREEPPDFDTFWQQTLAEARQFPLNARFESDVLFLCHYRRALAISDAAPYSEIKQYCHTHRDKIDTVFRTLAYFDGVNLAARCRAPALFSVGLMDQICPPSTVYAAYNHFAGPKPIRIYPYNEHEGGGTYQTIEKIRFLTSMWGGA